MLKKNTLPLIRELVHPYHLVSNNLALTYLYTNYITNPHLSLQYD